MASNAAGALQASVSRRTCRPADTLAEGSSGSPVRFKNVPICLDLLTKCISGFMISPSQGGVNHTALDTFQ